MQPQQSRQQQQLQQPQQQLQQPQQQPQEPVGRRDERLKGPLDVVKEYVRGVTAGKGTVIERVERLESKVDELVERVGGGEGGRRRVGGVGML